jgi:hypothetical protein
MFISKSELHYLKETIKHLDYRLDKEREKRYALEADFDRLLAHLKLEVTTIEPKRIIKEQSHD